MILSNEGGYPKKNIHLAILQLNQTGKLQSASVHQMFESSPVFDSRKQGTESICSFAQRNIIIDFIQFNLNTPSPIDASSDFFFSSIIYYRDSNSF